LEGALIEVVTSRNALLYQDALQDMFRLRRRSLIASGVAAAPDVDPLGKDRFDTDAAMYLLLTTDAGTVIGGHRLLPTLVPHAFSDVSPELCAVRGIQRGEKILEAAFGFVDEESLDKAALERARNRILVGLFEFCLRAGYEKIVWLMPADMLYCLLLIGLAIKPLGIPVVVSGRRQVAVAVTADAFAFENLRTALHVPETQVEYVGATLGDPLVLAAMGNLEHPRAAA
jgi:N-acyl-L-homoserine lactone synthetase